MRVRFTDDFDYMPSGSPRVLIAYRKGMDLTVKREAGEAATVDALLANHTKFLI